ncbi:MAG: RNA 2',3'-cyclic phosphodiesterase [Tissierellaceae bacterium]|nr:RNA 2',3'-cyclic phosphodiesterase [Tissierellaceae bacterium]
MRLFIAINFDECVKNDIKNIVNNIEKYAEQGRFVSKEHMHLTLEFLGEVSEERVNDIISGMKILNAVPFSLSLTDLGYFKRKDGNIYWFGVAKNKELINMQKELHNLLLEKEFELEQRDYTPHLTIGRKVKLINTINLKDLTETINKIQIDVKSIDLMKSENINGKLVYTIIFSKNL